MKMNLQAAGLCILLLLKLPSWAQTQQNCANIVPNPTFLYGTGVYGTPYYWGHTDPFKDGHVSPWVATNRDPMLNSTGTGNGPTGSPPLDPNAFMWSQNYMSSGTKIYNGEGIGVTIPSLSAGKKYVFSVMAKRESGTPQIEHFFTRLLYTQSQIPPSTTSIQPVPGSNTEMILDQAVTSTSYTQFTSCFTPQAAWTFLWMYPQNDPVNLNASWLNFDDVEIVPLFDFSGPDAGICPGECVWIGLPDNCSYLNLTASYEWRVAGNSTIIGTDATIEVCPTTTTTYTVKKTIGGCSETEDVVVNMLGPTPTVQYMDEHICYGTTLELNSPCPSGATSKWYEGTNTTQIVGPDGPTFTRTNMTSNTTIVSRCYNANGCLVLETFYNIIVSPDPAPQTFNPHVCEGNSFDLNSILTTNTTCTWYIAPKTPSSLPISSPIVSPTTNTSYVSECVDQYGCPTSNEVNITVSPATQPSITVNLCSGQALTFAGYASCTNWEELSTHATVGASVVPPSGTTTYRGQCINAFGCPYTQDVIAVVTAPYTAPPVTAPAICAGATFDLSNYSNGNTCTWIDLQTGANASAPSEPVPGTHTYRGTCTDANGCIYYRDVTVTVNAPYVVPGVTIQLCEGATLDLSQYSTGNTCTWMDLQSQISVTPVFIPTLGTHIYQGTCRDANGCLYTIEVTVNVTGPVATTHELCMNTGDHPEFTLPFNCPPGSVPEWTQNGVPVSPVGMISSAGSYEMICRDANGCVVRRATYNVVQTPGCSTQIKCLDDLNPVSVICPFGSTHYTVEKDGMPYSGPTPLSGTFTPDGTSGSYTVICRDANGNILGKSYHYYHKCDGSQDLIWNPSGIKNEVLIKPEISVYPNPTTGKYEVSVKTSEGIQYAIRVLDMTGREVLRCENLANKPMNIDMTDEKRGMYRIQIFLNGEVYTRSLVIQ
jgi:hypothetical protein